MIRRPPNHKTFWLVWTLLALTAISGRAQARDPVEELSEARRVYVPLEEFETVIEHDKQGVVLPKARFDALLAQAKANLEKNPVPSGAPVVLSGADYTARIAGDQLLISVSAELTQFADRWCDTRFGLQRLSLEQAILDGEPALVGRNSDGTVSLFTETRGKHSLNLRLSTELTAQGSDQIAAFSLLRASSGSLAISLPAGKRLMLGNLNLTRPKPLDQVADYKIAVGGLGGVQLRITDRATENAADSMTFASTGYGLKVAPGEVTWHALTTLQVFGKPVDRLTFSVPSQLEIADVEATGLESWDLSDDQNEPKRTVISLTFGQAFEGLRKISFKGVMATETEKPWSVPPLRIANVTSHIGQVVIQHAAGVRLRVEETSGVRRATAEQKPAADMPDDAAKLNPMETLRFDVWQPDFTLRMMTQPKQREVQTAVASVLDVNVTGLDLQVAMTVETHFAPLFELDVHLPVEWQVLSVKRDDQPLQWQIVGLDQPGMNQLRIMLNPSLAAEASGQIRLALRRDVEGWPVEAEPITVNLPELFLPQSSLAEGALIVRGDDDLDLAALDLSGLDSQPLKADYERLRFQSQDTRFSGKLKITRKPSRVSAQTIAVGRIDPQTVHVFLQALVEAQGGGIRTLQVALPEAAGASLRFECSGRQIVEQKPVEVVNGERIWNLQFDQRLRGQAIIITDLELPRGEAKEFPIPQWRFLNAERQIGYFAVEASGEQRLTIAATDSDGAALSEIDPLDLPQVFYRPKERLVAVYRSVGPGAALKLTEQKFEKLPIPTAICPLLEISTILGRTGELQHQATFQLDLVGVQGLHLTFPVETTLWATLINGRPVEVRRNGDVYLVPLTGDDPAMQQLTDGGTRTVLQLFYRSGIRPVSQTGTVNQDPPALTVESGQRVALPIEVLTQKWNLFYPEEIQIVDSHGPLETDLALDRTGTLGNLMSSLRVPSFNDFVLHLLLLTAIAVISLVIKRGIKLSVMIAIQIGLVLLLLAFLWPATSRSIYKARMPAPASAPDGGIVSRKSAGAKFMTEERFDKKAISDRESLHGMPTPPGVPEYRALDGKEKADAPQMAAEHDRMAPADDAPMVGFGAVAQKDNKGDQNAAADRVTIVGMIDPPPMPEGLLSLQIGFEPPAGSRQRTFYYVGADAGAPLELNYVDRSSREQVRVFMMALFGLISWFLRRAEVRTKIKLAMLGISAPLILAPFVPVYGQNLIDGCVFGTLFAILIWLLRAMTLHCRNVRLMQTLGSNQSSAVSSAVLIISLFAFSGSAFAQEKPAAPQVPTVIVPFVTGTEPLASDRVFLSQEQFLKLYQTANPEKGYKQPAPTDGGLIEALYAAKLALNQKNPEESVIEVTGRYAIRNLIDGQFVVDLPVGAVSVRAAKLNGESAPLIANAGGLSVAINKPGLHVIDLVFAVPARLSGSTGSVVLPLKPVPAGKLAFELPDKDLSVRINGSTTIFRRVTQANSQSVEIPVDRGGDIAIAWQPQLSQGAAAAVVHVDSVEAFTLTDAGAAVSHGFAYHVRQGGISDVSFTLPDTLKLQAVKGPDVGGWELQGEQGARKLRVIFRRNVTDQTRLTIETFLDVKVSSEAAVISAPQVAPLEVTTEIGQVAVFTGRQFSIRAEQTESLVQVDSDKFNTLIPISRPEVQPELAYRFSKRPFSLNLRVQRLESQAHVAAQQAVFITLHKQNITTRLRYNLTGAPRSSVSASLPAGFVLLDVQATGLRDWYVSKQDEGSLLTIELNSPRIGLIEVVIAGFTASELPLASVKFPQPVDVTRLETSSAIWLDEGFTSTVASSEGWRSIDAAHVSPELQSVRQDHPAQFAFTSTSAAPAAIVVNVTQSTARLSANGLSMVTVTDVAVIYTLALQWRINAAQTESLTFTTPDWLAGKLEFSGEGLRETVHTDAGNNRTRWTIHLRSPRSGKYFVAATATLPPPANQVLAPSIVFESEQNPLETQRQYVLLINSSLSQLTSVDPSLIESVQREDVPLVIQQEFVDQATELVRVKSLLNPPLWSVHRFAQQQGAPASVNVADLTTIISRDGTYRAEGILTIKNRSRQFLALKMPEGTELLSVFVAGQPSRAVVTKLPSLNGAAVQLIALPKTSAVGLSFPVKIVWRGKLDQALPKSSSLEGKELNIPAPQILSQQQDAEFGIPVARTRWTVYLPEDLEARASRSTSRHNLSLSDGSEQIYGKALLEETSLLCGYVDQMLENERMNSSARISSRQKGAATNALKQLGVVLSDYDYRGADQAEFNKNKQDVLKRLSDIEKKTGLNQAADDRKKDNLLGDEALVNQEIAENQKRLLITGNRDDGLNASKSDMKGDVKFNFDLSLQQVESGKQVREEELARKKSEGKPALQGRASLRMSNDVNVEALNTIVTDNTKSRMNQAPYSNPQAPPQNPLTGQPPTSSAASLATINGPAAGGNNFLNFSDNPDAAGFGFDNSGIGNLGVFWRDQLSLPGAQNPAEPANRRYGIDLNFDGSQKEFSRATAGGFQVNAGVPINAGGGMGGLGGNGVRGDNPYRNWRVAPPEAHFGRANVNGTQQFESEMGGVSFRGAGQKPRMEGNQFNDPQAAPQGQNFDNLWGGRHLAAQGLALQGGGGTGTAARAPEPWKQPGGLSLDIQLPKTGRKLVFTKTGGDPKLALIVRPQQSSQMGMKYLWSLLWLFLAVLTFWTLQKPDGISGLMNQLPKAAIGFGVFGFIFLPSPLSFLSLGLFLVGALAMMIKSRQLAPKAA